MSGKIPSAIKSIELNRATFSEESVDDLTSLNFFYGNNGTGKSTVANAVKEDEGLVWSNGMAPNDFDILVYNSDYVAQNFADYGELKGVFIVGKENIEANKRIRYLAEKQNAAVNDLNAALNEYKKNTAAVELAFKDFGDKCFLKTAENRKYFSKALKGKKMKKNFAEAVLKETNPSEQNLLELERLYDAAFDDSARAYPEFNRVDNLTANNLPGKELLNKAILSSGDAPFGDFIKALGSSASDWVREGYENYNRAASGKCPYCQQLLPHNFEKNIAEYFDARYRQQTDVLKQFAIRYEEETKKILKILNENMIGAMPSVDIKQYNSKIELLETYFTINRQRISEKIKEPAKVIYLEDTDSLIFEIRGLIDDINNLIKSNNDVVSDKRANQIKCKKGIMQHFAYTLWNEVKRYKDDVIRLNKEIKAVIERGKKIRNEINQLNAQISELKKRGANTAAAVESVNRMLADTGFQGFSMRAKAGNENVYEIVRKDGSVAENLSDGERNFIAFLYFYHQVRGSLEKEKIVVIDDPVSGMDNTALFAVGAVIREMINDCLNNAQYNSGAVQCSRIKQLFILTHNVNLYREITNGQVSRYNTASFYLIRKYNNVSTVKLCTRKNENLPLGEENYNPVQNYYSALWDELKEIKTGAAAVSVMRRILEYYFLRLSGYDLNELRKIVLEDEENRGKFIKEAPGYSPDMTDYRIASVILSYFDSADGINNEFNYAEYYDNPNDYMRVFEKIFEALDQSRHFKMMKK